MRLTNKELEDLKAKWIKVNTPNIQKKINKGWKYWSKKNISLLNIKFQSELELRRYNFLELMVKTWKIKSFEYEPKKFLLQESFKYNWKNYPIITYTPDFKVVLNNWLIVWEDTKSIATKKKESYRIKMKLFVKKYIINDDTILDFKEIFIDNDYYFDI